MNPEQPFRTAECLTPEQLEAVLEGRLPAAHAHLNACAACEQELANLREFLAAVPRPAEAQDLAWMESRLARPVQPRARRSWLSWLPTAPVPRFAFTCAAALLVLAGGLQLRHMAAPSLEDSQSLTVRSIQFRLLAPAGDLESAPPEFRWEPVAQAAGYEVQLTEVDGTLLWSARANQPNLPAPASIQDQLLPRKTLLWRVRALDDRGVTIAESQSERIRLLPAGQR